MPTDRQQPLKDVPVVVLGASGFVGSHLCAELNRRGLRPVAAVRSTSDLSRHERLGVEVTPLKIDTEEGFSAAFHSNQRLVINCATAYARTGDEKASTAVRDNMLLPLRVIDSTGPKCAFIHLDTFSAVAPEKHAGLPEYHLSKRQLRQWLALEQERTIFQVRLEHVYGPLDATSKFVTFVLRSLVENAAEIELTEGLARRDFVYVTDVSRALAALSEGILDGRLFGHQTLELGTGSSTSVRDFVTLAKSISGATTQLQFGRRPSPAQELAESKADLENWTGTGWQPEVSLEEGIRLTLRSGVSG